MNKIFNSCDYDHGLPLEQKSIMPFGPFESIGNSYDFSIHEISRLSNNDPDAKY